MYIPSNFSGDPKTLSSGSASAPPARSGPVIQDVAVSSAEDGAICCVPPLPRDRLLTTGKRRFAYSLTVVHFRKVVIRKKIGSAGNGHPVIYQRDCFMPYHVLISSFVYKMNHNVYINCYGGK